jgi:hypothetical protein
MPTSKKLLDFIRREFQMEEDLGFTRLTRVPDSRVAGKLRYYFSLPKADRMAFADYLAHTSCNHYAFVVGATHFDLRKHPSAYLEKAWLDTRALSAPDWNSVKSVPLLRAMVQTYKIDQHRGTQSCVSKKQFEYASSIRSIKAPELRKRLRATLKPLGYYKTDELGYYLCRMARREFRVGADFGGRYAQLRYVVVRPEFKRVHPLDQFRFEQVMGLGRGDWDFIIEENVDEVFSLLRELVQYCFELPDRMRLATK